MPLRKMSTVLPLLLILILLLMAGSPSALADGDPAPQPTKKDKCPVCGMFAHRYPDFLASITFQDGHKVFFDGAKDMFKYYFGLKTYAPDRRMDHIARIFVTEYYGMEALLAREAFFVVGSDVYGPMGHELIPFASRTDAEGFLKDHQGRRIVTFETVTPAVIRRLD